MEVFPASIDEKSLESITTFLHDARFTADAIESDNEEHSFSIKCWVLRTMPDGACRWRAYLLTLSSVIKCRVLQKEEVRFYEIANLLFDSLKQTLEVVTHYAFEINVDVDGLKGLLTETDETRSDWS